MAESMKCPREDAFVAFVEGRLEPEALAGFEAHIDACRPCAELLGALAGDASDASGVGGMRTIGDPDTVTSPRFEPGARVDRYVVLGRIGAGGMGVVYLAYDTQLDRRVALKLVAPGALGTDADASRRRLMREAKATAALAHPNVVTVHDAGTHGEQVFLAMEYVEGMTLTRWLRQTPAPTRGEIEQMFCGCAEGLAAAHAAGLVHRDFKPDNVLVGTDGRPRIADFGLARHDPTKEGGARTLQGLSLTRTGAIAGTPAYMSPEQHLGRELDARSDQFSFCIVLYEALVGTHPFSLESASRLSLDVIEGRMTPPPRALPTRLRGLLVRGLALDAADRFASMEALLVELRRDPWSPLRRALAVLAVGCVIALTGVVGWLATRPGTVRVVVLDGTELVVPTEVVVGDTALALDGSVLEGEVEAGLHPVRVEADGYETAIASVRVERGGVHEVSVVLQPEQGEITLDVEPRGGSVQIDGEDRGGRLRRLPVRAGKHELLARREGNHDRRFVWHVVADEHHAAFVHLPSAVVWSEPRAGASFGMGWLGDLDGDGRQELFHRSSNTIEVTDPWRGRRLWSTDMGPRNPDTNQVRVCDVDGDAALELVTLVHDRERLVLRVQGGADGAQRFAHQRRRHGEDDLAQLQGGPCLDLDGDTAAELVTVGWDRGALTVFDGVTGRRKWSADLGGLGLGLGLAVSRDPSPAVFVATPTEVVAFEAGGAVRWRHPLPEPTEGAMQRLALTAWGLPTLGMAGVDVANLDRDPGLDVLVHAHDPKAAHGVALVALAGATGRTLWSIDAHDGAALGSTAFVRDVDGDGRDDVLIGTSHWPIRESVETALVDGATGRPRWRRPAIGRAVLVGWPRGKVSAVATPEDVVVVDALTGDDGVSVSAPSDARMIAPVVLDWDADGDEELVVAHVDGMIAAYDSEGELVGSALLPRAAEMFGEPGDHDGDGIADLDVDAAGPLVWTGARQRWERRAAKGLRASALVEDLDGDGEHEVIVSGRFEGVDAAFAFDARTGATKGRLARDPIHWMRAPIVARRDDGGADILATVFGGREELVRIDGATLEIQRAVPVPMTYASPALHDVDGDGADELLLAPWSGSTGIEARDPRTLEVEWTAPAHGGSWLAPVLVLGPDSERLVVDAFTDHALVAVSGVDGSPRWTVDLGLTNKGGLAVVDDGEGPVVVAVGNGLAGSKLVADVVVLAAADGTQRRRLEAIGNGGTAPLVVDIDDDGRLDVVSRTAEARVVAVPLRGGPPLWEYAPPIGESRAASGLPLLVDDLDGDGAHELVIAFRDGSLHVLDAATGTLERRHDLGAVAERPPVPVDLDADGRKELIVTLSDGRLVCLASGPAHDLGRNARPAG